MTPADDKEVFAIVLAAGSASRFGNTKQLVEFDGSTLVDRAVAAATDACDDRLLLVIGHDWKSVVAASRSLRGFIVFNDRHEEGMGTSIACAVASVRHVADAVIVLLADQPLIDAHHLRALRQAWSGRDDEIVATSFAGTLGPPVLFPRACFDDLAALEGDSGGRDLLADGRFAVRSVQFEDAAHDVDTTEDLNRLFRGR